MGIEGGEVLVVHDVHGGDRELVGVEPAPGIAGVAIDDGLEVDLAHALEMADEEGVDGHEVAGMAGLDVAFAELGAEPFQQPDLFGVEIDLALTGGLLKPQQARLFGQELLTGPHAADPSGGDLHALERQLLGDPQGAVGGVIQGMGEDGGPHLLRDPVGMRPPGARQPVHETFRPVGLVVAPDLVELLA